MPYHEHQRQSRSETTGDGHGPGPSGFGVTVLIGVFFVSGESVWHHLSWIFGGWMGNGEALHQGLLFGMASVSG